MTERDRLLQAIATIIEDYRAGEIEKPNAQHVDRWVKQFPNDVQQPIMAELEHVLQKTYLSKKFVIEFLNTVLKSEKLVGNDPCTFWSGVKFLKIQTAGNSQREMLEIFDAALKALCNFKSDHCVAEPHSFVYIDDAVFSGGRVQSDMEKWIAESAPQNATVHVLVIALHLLGVYFTELAVAKAAKAANKSIKLHWMRIFQVEDRKFNMNNSDVLRPTMIPDDPATQAYVNGLGSEPILRTAGKVGKNGFFSSEQGRSLLEQEFLKAGVRIRGNSPYLNQYMRPLGNSLIKSTGFGSTLVTFRNCPNNAPLVFWAGNPWYPLFPRKTN